MWSVKFEFDGSNIFLGNISKKYNIILTGYNISSYQKNKELYVNIVGNIKGELKDKKLIFNHLKNSKYVKKIEMNNDFLMVLIKEDPEFMPFDSPYFIYASPVIIENGIYHYHLASWYREEIEKLLKYVRNNFKCKLQMIKDEKIKNISLIGIQPNLTAKQKKAYELAVDNGYYEYPKKIELKQLAKISKISYSTYQQHLKYAEKKLANFFCGKY